MALRRVARLGVQALEAELASGQCTRPFARLPGSVTDVDMSRYTLRDVSKRPLPPPPAYARAPPSNAPAGVPLDDMQEAAKAISASMFPWERRQMDAPGKAKGLNSWERFYWGAFATMLAFLGGVQVYKQFEKPPPKV